MKLRYKLKLWWNRLWIREDEFHSSLDLDVNTMHDITENERQLYLKDLMKRRQIAHQRDMDRIQREMNTRMNDKIK